MCNQLTDHTSDSARRAISFNTLLNGINAKIRLFVLATPAKAMAS